MRILLLDMIWPALYVQEAMLRFWFLVFGTVAIETLALKGALKTGFGRALLLSTLGNLVSGLVGTYVMTFGMLGWHAAADGLLHGTFAPANWVATFALMCLGSVLIETGVVKLLFRHTATPYSLKQLFPPMLVGNLATYLFIFFAMWKGGPS